MSTVSTTQTPVQQNTPAPAPVAADKSPAVDSQQAAPVQSTEKAPVPPKTLEEIERDIADRYGYSPTEKEAQPVQYASDDSTVEVTPVESDDSAGKQQASEGAKAKEASADDSKEKAFSRADWADYGLSREEAQKLEEAGTLGMMLDVFDRKIMEIGRKVMESESSQQPVKSVAETTLTPQEVVPPKAEVTPKSQEPDPFDVALDPEVYDEGVIKQFTGMASALKSQRDQISRLERMVQGMHGSVMDQQRVAFTDRMDTFFNNLGEDYEDLVGKGKVGDFKADDPRLKARQSVVETMAMLVAGCERAGLAIPDESVIRERAWRMVHGARIQEVTQKQVADRARNALGQFISRPSHREANPLTGVERADQRLEQFYRDKGLM